MFSLLCFIEISLICCSFMIRIDFTLEMSVPGRLERLDYTLQALHEVLSKYGNTSELSCLKDLLSLKKKEQRLTAIMSTHLPSKEDVYVTPETDRPVEDINIHNDTLTFIRGNINTFSTDKFEVLICLKALLCLSDGWSYREMKQFLLTINYVIMCSELCRLTSCSWMKELIYFFD